METTLVMKEETNKGPIYQAIGDSVVLSPSNKNNFSNDSQNKINRDVLSKVIQSVPVKE